MTVDEVTELLMRALHDPKGFGRQTIEIQPDMLRMIAAFADGDGRTALNTLEMVVLNGEQSMDKITVTEEVLAQCISQKSLLYDKSGEEHYNLISALHKSMRNTDPDAAIYWLARMLEAGEDPVSYTHLLQNPGIDAFLEQYLPELETLDTVLIANIAGAAIEEYCQVAEKLQGVEAVKLIELNISCPNVAHGLSLIHISWKYRAPYGRNGDSPR